MGGTVEYQFCTKSETLLLQDYETIKQALHRLESIDNTEPSEALECLEEMENYNPCQCPECYTLGEWCREELETIKQALLKAQENARSEEILQKYYQEGITLDSVRELEKENELLKEIIKSLFDRGCPLHQYTDKEGVLTIEVDSECSIMRIGIYKGVDLDKKLKEVLE